VLVKPAHLVALPTAGENDLRPLSRGDDVTRSKAAGSRLCAIAISLVIAMSCGTAASNSSQTATPATIPGAGSPVPPECAAPMDEASPSLAGRAPAWITFDRSTLGPRNAAQASADPIGILIVVADEVRSVRFYVVDGVGRRLGIISGQPGALGPVDELNLRQDQAQDRGNVWLTRIAVKFAEPGCYYGVFEDLPGDPRRVEISIYR
jgi:hypothetical protein